MNDLEKRIHDVCYSYDLSNTESELIEKDIQQLFQSELSRLIEEIEKETEALKADKADWRRFSDNSVGIWNSALDSVKQIISKYKPNKP